MPDATLVVEVSGSAFELPFDSQRFAKEDRALLDCADGFTLLLSGCPVVSVELDGMRRWIAFEDDVSGSPAYCVGYQETVGAILDGKTYIGGSNRKMIAQIVPGGYVTVLGVNGEDE